jgi:general secretion pathway protein K
MFYFSSKLTRHSQKGVALIQVLLISAIISILAIRFSLTARDQIETATSFEQRVKATQLLKSTQSKIIYTLLTEEILSQDKDAFPNSDAWNFYGKPIVLFKDENELITIMTTIQSNAGLLSQRYVNTPFWHKALSQMNYSENEIEKIQGELKDWQDRDTDSWLIGQAEPDVLENGQPYRNQAIQLPQEINWFFSETPENINTIKKISTPYAMPGLNFMYAPDLLLSLMFDADLAIELINQREQQELTNVTIMSLLGDLYDDEIISFSLGNKFKVITQVTLGDVKLQETMEIQLQPRKTEPVLVFSRY